MKKKNPVTAYIITGTLFMLWQTSSWLYTELHPLFGVTSSYNSLNFIVYSLSGAAGLLLGAFICDSRLKIKRQLLASLLFAGAAIFTSLRPLISDFTVFAFDMCLSSLFGFAAHAIILFELFRKFPYKQRALVTGAALSLMAIIRLPANFYAGADGKYASQVFLILSVAALFLDSIFMFTKPVSNTFNSKALHENEDKRQGSGRLIWMGILCSLFIYTLHGIFDAAIDGTFVYSLVIYFRILQAVTPILVGLLCYRFGYTGSIVTGIAFIGMGVFCYYFSYGNIAAFIFAMLSLSAFYLFAIPMRAMFTDMSFFSTRPAMVTSLGFVTYFIFQTFGWPISTGFEHISKDTAFVFYLLIFILSVPIMVYFFTLLYNSYMQKNQPEEKTPQKLSLRSLNLTRREEDVFLLLIRGLPVEEISEKLFLSDSTVKWHQSNILKKTGVKSRIKLIEEFKGYAEE